MTSDHWNTPLVDTGSDVLYVRLHGAVGMGGKTKQKCPIFVKETPSRLNAAVAIHRVDDFVPVLGTVARAGA